MKKIQLTDALRNIKKRFVSYLSIVFIIMLGTGGFLMTRYAGTGIRGAAKDFFIASNFKDFELASSIGLTQASIDKVNQIEGVTDTEGVETLAGKMTFKDSTTDVTLISWTERISVPLIVSGTKPEKTGECAVGNDFARSHNLSVGDVIQIATDDIYGVHPLLTDTCTITAIVRHPDFSRSDAHNVIVLPLESFNLKDMEYRYMRLYVKADARDDLMFSKGYTRSVKGTADRLKELIHQLEADTLDDAKRLANLRIEYEMQEAQAQIDDARRQISEGEAALEAKLAEGKQQLAAGKAQLANAYRQLISGEAQLRDAEAMLASVRKVRDLLRGKSPAELLGFVNEVNGYIDAYNQAADDWTREQIRNALKEYLSQDPAREYAAIIKDISGIDLNQAADNPPSLIPAQNAMRDVTSILLLAAAADEGINPVDIYQDVETISKLSDEINAAPNEEAANAAREKLAAYLADPEVQRRLGFVSQYLGIDVNELIWLSSMTEMDQYQLVRFHDLLRQMRIAKNSIANAESMVAQGRAKLAAGWAQYYAGLKLLQEKEAEMNELEAQARAQLADANAQLEQKIAEGEAELTKARARVESLTCSWIVQERDVNGGYMALLTNSASAFNLGYALGILFLIVAALVVFSTLIIIIEEETKLVGTAKAFGFTNREILAKYMVFALSASVVGAILGILVGVGIAALVQGLLTNTRMFIYSFPKIRIELWSTVVVSLGAIALSAAVTLLACSDLLRNSAYNLLNGLSNKKHKNRKKKTSSNKRGSLYSRLIIRNMITEKARVLISILIIAGSTTMVGTGLSLKAGFDGMTKLQLSRIIRYDYAVSFESKMPQENLDKLEQLMETDGVSFLPVLSQGALFEQDDRLQGLSLLCADPAELDNYYAIRDLNTFRPVPIPSHGILIQRRLNESFGIRKGDILPILNSTLVAHNADVVGYFENYLDRLAVCSPESYREIFGTDPVCNAYYLKLNGMNETEFLEQIKAISPDFTVKRADDFLHLYNTGFVMYNAIVMISILIAIIMSFIVLTNLASIFLNRKKTELIVMRINGFTQNEALIYLSKETLLTILIGLAAGVLFGTALSYLLIRIVEPTDAQFARHVHVFAWVIAVLLEGSFAFLINWNVFRRVRKLNFRDIM